MSSRDFKKVGFAAVAVVTPASPANTNPKTGDGFVIEASEIWLFTTAAAGTGFTADVIPWYLIPFDPSQATQELQHKWVALAKIEGMPLDGAESLAANGGQIRLLDAPGFVAKRIFLEWTALGAPLEFALWQAVRQQ